MYKEKVMQAVANLAVNGTKENAMEYRLILRDAFYQAAKVGNRNDMKILFDCMEQLAKLYESNVNFDK